MSEDGIAIEALGSVKVVHLDDGKANAFSKARIATIKAAVLEAEADDATGAVVVHGRPGCFSGGFDLGVMRGGDAGAILDLVSDGGDLVRTCYGAGVPVVAACTGHAVAAGALLLLGCDMRVGADLDAKIGLPEVTIQMALPQWAISMATERLSRRHLQRATANGRMTGPAEAVDVGYLDEVVAPDAVLDRAVEIATELATTLHNPSYRAIVAAQRGPLLERLDAEIAGDRII
ncbi:MAG: crotonase/enoyl-CoA hydratase family protein [Actinobacteria bacterium]|nr:crotonase/enoyl-CoA hydratase family protein [Actinomycetota bacterium]